MGKHQSKESKEQKDKSKQECDDPKARLTSKDWKFMAEHHPNSYILNKWITDNGYNGKLQMSCLLMLKGQIKQDAKGNAKKEQELGGAELETWLKVAGDRAK